MLDSIIGAKHSDTHNQHGGAENQPQKPQKKHFLTLTSDNGKDFPSHPEIIENLGSAFLFLHALSLLGARFKREYHRVGTAVLYQRYVFF